MDRVKRDGVDKKSIQKSVSFWFSRRKRYFQQDFWLKKWRKHIRGNETAVLMCYMNLLHFHQGVPPSTPRARKMSILFLGLSYAIPLWMFSHLWKHSRCNREHQLYITELGSSESINLYVFVDDIIYKKKKNIIDCEIWFNLVRWIRELNARKKKKHTPKQSFNGDCFVNEMIFRVW